MKPLRSKRVGPQSGTGDSARSGARPSSCRIRKDRRAMARASGACTFSVRRADDRLGVHQTADRQVPRSVLRGQRELIAGLLNGWTPGRGRVSAPAPLRAGLGPLSPGSCVGAGLSSVSYWCSARLRRTGLIRRLGSVSEVGRPPDPS